MLLKPIALLEKIKSLKVAPQWHPIARRVGYSLITLLIAYILLTQLDAMKNGYESLGMAAVARDNETYLTTTEVEATETFVVLSAIKSSLATLQSSQGGISFIIDVEVQVGQLLSSLTDMVGYAWHASLAGLGVITGMDIGLQLLDVLFKPLLALTILVLAGHWLLSFWPHLVSLGWRTLMASVSQWLMMVLIATQLIIPIAIYATSLFASTLTALKAEQAHDHFVRAHETFHFEPEDGLHDHVEDVMQRYRHLAKSDAHKRHHTTLLHAVVQHVVVLAFNVFLFPLLIFLLLHALNRRLVHSVTCLPTNSTLDPN